MNCFYVLQASKIAVSATQKTKELTHAVNEKVYIRDAIRRVF